MKEWIQENVMRMFALIVIVIYSLIVHVVSINIGLYAGIMVLVLLLVLLPLITPKEKLMSSMEMKKFGKTEIDWGSYDRGR